MLNNEVKTLKFVVKNLVVKRQETTKMFAISGGELIALIIMLMVKTYGYNSSRTTLRVLEEDPNINKEAARAVWLEPKGGNQSASQAFHVEFLCVTLLSWSFMTFIESIPKKTSVWRASHAISTLPIKVKFDIF